MEPHTQEWIQGGFRPICRRATCWKTGGGLEWLSQWKNAVVFVSYYRVSTDRQGRSGLGLDAQKHAVHQRLDCGRWQLVAEFVEIESGKRAKRPQLDAALTVC